MTDINDVTSSIDECQLNMNNLGHEWYSRAYDCQTLLDATGDSMNTPGPAGTPQQFFHRTFTIPFTTDLLNEMKHLFSPMQKRAANWLCYEWNQSTLPMIEIG